VRAVLSARRFYSTELRRIRPAPVEEKARNIKSTRRIAQWTSGQENKLIVEKTNVSSMSSRVQRMRNGCPDYLSNLCCKAVLHIRQQLMGSVTWKCIKSRRRRRAGWSRTEQYKAIFEKLQSKSKYCRQLKKLPSMLQRPYPISDVNPWHLVTWPWNGQCPEVIILFSQWAG
jgi:hypothetical protein